MSEKLESVNKLVFVHGLNSTNKACWCDLPRLLRENEAISKKFEIIDDFNYSTGLVGNNTDISEICSQLIRHLGGLPRASQASSLTFVAHSQGGLVSRRCVVELIRYAKQRNIGLPVTRILTFATPHLGAYSSTAGKMLSSIISRQASELSFDSNSLSEINQAWSDERAEYRVEMLRVIAGKDGIVPEFSARGGRYDIDVINLADHDHSSCTKVQDVNHPAYKITCEFTLRPLSRRVGDLASLFGAPILRLNILSEPKGASQKVQFNAMQTKLVDREREIQALLDFCLDFETEGALSRRRAGGALWAHVRGGAGVGKSRLALELCLLLQRQDWHAGFLASNHLIRHEAQPSLG